VTDGRLQTLLGAELDRAAPAGALALAQELVRRGGNAVSVVLYYGSALRAGNLEGILDFYVLVDQVSLWPGSWLARLANRALPPNVGYLELDHEGERLRAKFAVLSRAQFARRLADDSKDTTLWARFCQPALCVWARSDTDRAAARELVADAVVRAATWAARLGPAAAPAEGFWTALFAHTYAAELRVEKAARPQDIVAKDPARYAALLPLAWQAAGITFTARNQEFQPSLASAEREKARRRWSAIARHGRRLNILRLLKASFTFDGGMDYVVWKIERHRGVRVAVKPWERRFPLLAAPFLYWRLRKMGVLSGTPKG
jgi:hypothetical protein